MESRKSQRYYPGEFDIELNEEKPEKAYYRLTVDESGFIMLRSVRDVS